MSMNKQTFICVKFGKEGIHRYPDAPDDVEFLRYPHRHIFHFTVTIEVFHDDRDIEFIRFKRELEALYSDNILDIDYMSCEMLADDLADYISEHYPDRRLKIEVFEDDENGAICLYGF